MSKVLQVIGPDGPAAFPSDIPSRESDFKGAAQLGKQAGSPRAAGARGMRPFTAQGAARSMVVDAALGANSGVHVLRSAVMWAKK